MFILFLPIVSALIISEVELNPSGSDSGNEWVEFYSSEEVDLSDYILKNGDGDEIELNGKFEGYFVFELEKQWLDNKDEIVYLYKGSELIDETDKIYDSKNNDYTLSYCDKEWKFVESSKGEKNNCPKGKEKVEKEKPEEEEKVDEPVKNKEIINSSPGAVVGDVVANDEVISLNPQTIKSDENFENTENKKTKYAFYGFILFCVLLLFLFVLRKLNYLRKSGIE